MFKLFKKFKKKFDIGSIFAYTKSLYIGKMIVLVDNSDMYENSFLLLPDMIPYTISKKEFNNNLKNNILDFIEVLPEDVMEVVRAQYLKNIHSA